MTSFLKPLLRVLAAACLLAPATLLAAPPDAPAARRYFDQSSRGRGRSRPGREAAAPAADADDHILMPGDLIEVKVFQEPDMDSTLRVAQDGAVVFPLIDRVKVGGLSPLAAAKLIQNLLNKDYLVNPHVGLRVIEYARRSFTVLGEVQKPGSYDIPDRSSVSLLEAIGMAGGYTRVANPSNVAVKRKVKNQQMIYHSTPKRWRRAAARAIPSRSKPTTSSRYPRAFFKGHT